jgi:hypothetical protein
MDDNLEYSQLQDQAPQPPSRGLPLLGWLAGALCAHIMLTALIGGAAGSAGLVFLIVGFIVWIPGVTVGRKYQAEADARYREAWLEYERASQAWTHAEREARKVVVGNWYGYRGE